MNKFHEMMAKKRDMKPSEKHAKLGVLKDLKDSLSDSLTDKMASSPMKKVSVMSNSPEGMAAGLNKAKQMTGQSPDDAMMSEGGLALAGAGPDEKYDGGYPMDENAQSAQDPMEPEHVTYDGSPDAEMGPGYFKGGEVGPNEADASDVTYSGDASGDDGFKHPDSDEDSDVNYTGSDFGKRDHNSDEIEAPYAHGGKVKSQLDEAADSADDEREQTEADMGDEEEAHPEFKGMDLQQVEEKLQHLMRMKKQMEKQ